MILPIDSGQVLLPGGPSISNAGAAVWVSQVARAVMASKALTIGITVCLILIVLGVAYWYFGKGRLSDSASKGDASHPAVVGAASLHDSAPNPSHPAPVSIGADSLPEGRSETAPHVNSSGPYSARDPTDSISARTLVAISPHPLQQDDGLSSLSPQLRGFLVYQQRRGCVVNVEQTLARCAAAEAIGLHGIPATPPLDRPLIDEKARDIAIAAATEESAPGLRWLMRNTQFITFIDLCNSLHQSCNAIADQLKKWNGNYHLLTIPGKSQAWMADLTFHFFPQESLPKGVLTMTRDENQVGPSVGEQIHEFMENEAYRNFVMIDDGLYSGEQFIRYLEHLCMKICQCSGIQTKGERVRKKIIFIFGFFNAGRFERVNYWINSLQTHGIDAQLIAGIQVPTLGDRIKNASLARPLIDSIQRVLEMCTEGDRDRMSAPLVSTEWKVPDAWTLPLAISEGKLGTLRRVPNPEEDKRADPPFVRIIPPYQVSVLEEAEASGSGQAANL